MTLMLLLWWDWSPDVRDYIWGWGYEILTNFSKPKPITTVLICKLFLSFHMEPPYNLQVFRGLVANIIPPVLVDYRSLRSPLVDLSLCY